jgi:hypothetical protein
MHNNTDLVSTKIRRITSKGALTYLLCTCMLIFASSYLYLSYLYLSYTGYSYVQNRICKSFYIPERERYVIPESVLSKPTVPILCKPSGMQKLRYTRKGLHDTDREILADCITGILQKRSFCTPLVYPLTYPRWKAEL